MRKEPKDKQEMLQQVVTWFSEDPNKRRCRARSGVCKYTPRNDNQIGCAIGMFLPPKIQKKFDGLLDNSSLDNSSIVSIIGDEGYLKDLPNWMQKINADNPLFLHRLQNFHDEDFYWDRNTNKISPAGVEFIKLICTKYSINFEEIKI